MPNSAASAPNAPKTTLVSLDSKTLAVTRCSDAFKQAYADALENTTNEYEAENIAEEAFLAALPTLLGHEQISNFIACIAFAIAHDIVREEKTKRLLYAAQVALVSDRRKPRPERSAA